MRKIYFYDKYLFLNNVSGIYRFYNRVTQKSYIGRSNNIYQRIGEHLRHAHNKKDVCYNMKFYVDLRKFNLEFWEISCVYNSSNLKELIEKEAYFIKKFNTVENGYNTIYETNSGPIRYGEDSSNAKLTNKEVYEIREAYNQIEIPEKVYEKYKHKLAYATFMNIWRGYHYKNIHTDVYTKENKEIYKNRGNKNKVYNKGLYDNTISHVMDIREKFLEEKLSSNQVYQLHSELNRNTFNDIWYRRTFKEIAPEGYYKKLKSGRKYIK